ncbi:MAG: class I SAM-dependent methyltransferase [Elusimicrobiota bacterium]
MPRPYLKAYSFTKEWMFFAPSCDVWNDLLSRYRGRENVNYLEVGLLEGGSALWMLENILTHPTARMTGIEHLPQQALIDNLRLSGSFDKVTLLAGESELMLRQLPPASFDVVYLDGSHLPDDVMTDAVLSWGLLKPGGTLIFDDYQLWPRGSPNLAARMAIDAFLGAFQYYHEVLHRGYQVVIRKRTDADRRKRILMSYNAACFAKQQGKTGLPQIALESLARVSSPVSSQRKEP